MAEIFASSDGSVPPATASRYFNLASEKLATLPPSVYLPLTATIVICIYSLSRIPSPIPGVPYHARSPWIPGGDVLPLGFYAYLTGRVFDWLSLRCVALDSPIVQIFLPIYSTSRPVVLISDIQEIEDIAVKKLRMIDRAGLLHEFFGLLFPKATIGLKTDILFKRQRHLWSCMLSPKFLEEVVVPCLYESVEELIDVWRFKMLLAGGRAYEAGDDLKQSALDGMWTILAGTELGLLKTQAEQLRRIHVDGVTAKVKGSTAVFGKCEYPPLYKALSSLLFYWVLVVQGVNHRLFIWIFHRLPHFRATHRTAMATVDTAIARSQQRLLLSSKSIDPQGRTCALEEVLKRAAATQAGYNEHATDEAIKDELLELLISGHETTAVATAWGVKYLADNASAQSKLHQSIQDALPDVKTGRLPTAKEIMSVEIPYLNAFVSEVLRLSCTIPVSFRETLVDCNILGHMIPANTILILLTGGPAHLRHSPLSVKLQAPSSEDHDSEDKGRHKPRGWSLAYPVEEFIPERWMDNMEKFDPDAGPSLPFSAGIRGCFGKNIALIELRLLFIMLVWSFRFLGLEKELSRYSSVHGLTRKPTCCYVRLEMR